MKSTPTDESVPTSAGDSGVVASSASPSQPAPCGSGSRGGAIQPSIFISPWSSENSSGGISNSAAGSSAAGSSAAGCSAAGCACCSSAGSSSGTFSSAGCSGAASCTAGCSSVSPHSGGASVSAVTLSAAVSAAASAGGVSAAASAAGVSSVGADSAHELSARCCSAWAASGSWLEAHASGASASAAAGSAAADSFCCASSGGGGSICSCGGCSVLASPRMASTGSSSPVVSLAFACSPQPCSPPGAASSVLQSFADPKS